MSTTDDEAGTSKAAEADGDGAGEAGTKSTLAQQRAAREAARTSKQANGGLPRALKRYGPLGLIAVLLVGAIAVVSTRGGDKDDDDVVAKPGSLDEETLIKSGPMTPAKAELLGKQVDFGPGCDMETERIKLRSIYAPPCVEPFTGDNGGATYQGVTKDEILVVRYDVDPAIDPIGSALVRATGVETNPDTAFDTASDYVDIYNEVFELYGRKVKIVPFHGTGKSDDTEKAKADAIAIAEMKPFAVINGPLQSIPTFSAELANAGVVCMSPCTTALPDEKSAAGSPYLWQAGPTPDQAAGLAAELIGNLAGPGKAELAGDSDTKAKDRKYALVHYNNANGDQSVPAEALVDALGENGVTVDEDIEYLLDPATITEDARTLVTRLKSKGVTTVIFYGDPLMPASLTKQATEQDFHPEWILGPSLLADTAVFGRSFDQEQWGNGFGIGLPALQGEDQNAEAWQIYNWAYGVDQPPNNTYAIINPGIRNLFSGLQLAGPNLTPETFRDGMHRFPISGGSATRAQLSWGDHDVWDGVDLGGSDDASVIWWDPEAEGTDEAGKAGKGMYRFANGGERYTIGHFPKTAEEAGLFDDANSLIVYTGESPEAALDYPPPKVG